MNIKFTRNTAVEPLVAGANATAHITRKPQLFPIRRGKSKTKGMGVVRMRDPHGSGSTENMQIKITGMAMVAEPSSVLGAGIAPEEATGVDRGGEEGEGVGGVGGMCD